MAKRLDVGCFVVGFSVLPAAENNSNPFIGKSADCRVVILAATALKIVVSASPRRVSNRLISEFVEGLFDEFGAGEPMMNPATVAAALGDGSDSGMGLQFDSGRPSRAVGSQHG